MGDTMLAEDRKWVTGQLEAVGAKDVTMSEDKKGFKLVYKPAMFTVHQAQEFIEVVAKDGRFKDYGVNVAEDTIVLNY